MRCRAWEVTLLSLKWVVQRQRNMKLFFEKVKKHETFERWIVLQYKQFCCLLGLVNFQSTNEVPVRIDASMFFAVNLIFETYLLFVCPLYTEDYLITSNKIFTLSKILAKRRNTCFLQKKESLAYQSNTASEHKEIPLLHLVEERRCSNTEQGQHIPSSSAISCASLDGKDITHLFLYENLARTL